MVIDAGESATLIVVAERILGHIQIRDQVSIPAELGPADQLVPETLAQLRAEHDPIHVFFIIPQSETVSQRIAPDGETIEAFVARESERFQELQGHLPVIDHQLLENAPKPAYWLTYCQQQAITQRLQAVGLSYEDIDDVTSAAEGLWGMFEAARSPAGETYVIDLGRQHTSVMHVVDRLPHYATSFSARLWQGDHPAEPDRLIDWYRRLQKAPGAFDGLPQTSLKLSASDHVILAGDQRLFEAVAQYLKEQTSATITMSSESDAGKTSTAEFATALGVARASLGLSKLTVSLLPQTYRQRRNQRFVWDRLRGLNSVLAAIALVLLTIGIWQKKMLVDIKQELLEDTNQAIAKMAQTEVTLGDFAEDFERVRPILRFQQETHELIETLANLQQGAADPDYWLVLLADYDTYQSTPIINTDTNAVVQAEALVATNRFVGRSGFVAEFSFAQQGEAMRSKLVDLVNQLNDSGTYARVDTLPDDLRRPLAETNVVLADGHAALSLELPRNYFQTRLFTTGSEPARPTPPANREETETGTNFRERNEAIPTEVDQP